MLERVNGREGEWWRGVDGEEGVNGGEGVNSGESELWIG